jgi:hypothetical protein
VLPIPPIPIVAVKYVVKTILQSGKQVSITGVILVPSSYSQGDHLTEILNFHGIALDSVIDQFILETVELLAGTQTTAAVR